MWVSGYISLTFLCNDSLFKTAFYFGKENFYAIIWRWRWICKEKGLDVVSEMPKDWRKNPFATDPYGAVTIDNGKPFFANHKRNPEYKRMLLMEGV